MPRTFINSETAMDGTPGRLRRALHRRACRTLLATLAVAAAVGGSAIVPSEAKAYTQTDAFLACTDLIGFRLELPPSGSARQSKFYFRVDRGAWQTTHWYYTDPASWYVYLPGSGWQLIGMGGGFLPVYEFTTSGYHLVEAWEYRYTFGKYTWYDLGSCYASSFVPGDGGIVFR